MKHRGLGEGALPGTVDGGGGVGHSGAVGLPWWGTNDGDGVNQQRRAPPYRLGVAIKCGACLSRSRIGGEKGVGLVSWFRGV
jgi:hypothetical protein